MQMTTPEWPLGKSEDDTQFLLHCCVPLGSVSRQSSFEECNE